LVQGGVIEGDARAIFLDEIEGLAERFGIRV